MIRANWLLVYLSGRLGQKLQDRKRVDLPLCAQRLEVVGKERGLKRTNAIQKDTVVSGWKE